MYTFATREIVQEVPSMLFEKNYLFSLMLQAATFPRVYQDWERYEACAVEEISLGASKSSLSSLGSDTLPIESDKSATDVVLACSDMIDSYGLSIVARDADQEIV